MNSPRLSVVGLNKSFAHKHALTDISLDIHAGEILALLGPTGAGKTTTIRAIAGLESLSSGRVYLNGTEITHLSPTDRDVAVVFEGFNLLPTLSVYDNIAFPLRSTIYRETEEVISERVNKAADNLRIAFLLSRKVNQLSGGERQRVAIARALVRRPTLYMFDEPLSALDLKLRESLVAELREMQRMNGATMLYATHDYGSAASLGHRIALIENGHILQVGTLSELIATPRHIGVGRLIGSPAMVFFDVLNDRDMLSIEGFPWRWRFDTSLPAVAGITQRLILGIWPEDVELEFSPRTGFAQCEVHATDYRGLDRAIELRRGTNRVRKAIALEPAVQRGDSCWLGLPTSKIFAFNAQTGERVPGSLTLLESQE